jgi:acetyl/propionyl-CoA carboxylase alpha subunit
MPKITSVLIANRGEIAIRIAKTLARLGIRIFALKSPWDEGARHLDFADDVLELRGESLAETWLNAAQITSLAQKNGVSAIHPGYGFLSENAAFARVCREAGLIFIGPAENAIKAMGSKAEAKTLMKRAGVPVIPGYEGGDQSPEKLSAEALEAGFPVLIKASAGGGGKGMRVVRSESEIAPAIASAANEAVKSFGDGRLIVEKFIENPRHIEIQIFGDSHGNLIHLGERECSIQRRHQKIIEETPSTALTTELRAAMTAAALRCGRSLGYQNAGTVEFIVDGDGKFYFLEVNTRLQVEHPVTEMVTGFDLVEWQMRVAEGGVLPATQEDVSFRGHAVECRVYAEDAENGFLPSTGRLVAYEEPVAPFVRVDSGVREGSDIGIHFDPMISKVAASGATRAEAVSRLVWALENYPILGVKTNVALALDVLKHPAYAAGDISTKFIETHFPSWRDTPDHETTEALVRIAVTAPSSATGVAVPSGRTSGEALWENLKSMRLGGAA